MSDEQLYLSATKEVQGEKKDPAIWAKAVALAEGDLEKAKYRYIKLRVEKLAKKRADTHPRPMPAPEQKLERTKSDFPSIDYISIKDFSRIKGISEAKIVQMIRDGFYAGRIIRDEWFVSRAELGADEGRKAAPSNSNSRRSQLHYVPVEEFARLKGLAEGKAINMIRDGFYEGQVVDGKWYVAGDEAPNPNDSDGPSGVGGWLLLLIAGMIAIGPLLGAVRINAEIFMAEHQYPEITGLDDWGSYKVITWILFIGFAAISVYGGWGLAQGRSWRVVDRAKAILWATGPGASVVLGLLVPAAIFGGAGALDGQVVGGLIGSVIAATIWTLYLSRSKRVRNTYSKASS